jgi:hypothetical protein
VLHPQDVVHDDRPLGAAEAPHRGGRNGVAAGDVNHVVLPLQRLIGNRKRKCEIQQPPHAQSSGEIRYEQILHLVPTRL